MRQPRRLRADAHPSFYHCISRITAGERIFQTTDPACPEAERFVDLLHRLSAFCGIPLLTYALMGNHFHLLCEVPPPRVLSDSELLERVEALEGLKRRQALQRVLARQTPGGDLAAQAARENLQGRMGNLSIFLKELKSRFAQGYNRRHKRFGALWAERFKSLVVEEGRALQAVALYIDLNPVRAGLCVDPKDYRYSGYGEAVGAVGAQGERRRAGLARALGYAQGPAGAWAEVGAEYRRLLFRAGVVASKPEQAVLGVEQVRRVADEQQGALPLEERLGVQLRFFTTGLVLGSRSFVEAQLIRWGLRREGPAAGSPAPARFGGWAPGSGLPVGWAEWFVCWRGRAVAVRVPD